jgi:hypothetical protein
VPTFAGSFFSALGYVAARLSDEQIQPPSRALPKLKTPSPAAKKTEKTIRCGDFVPFDRIEGALGSF